MEKWPGPPEDREFYRRSPFGTTYAEALALLDREIAYLEGDHVIFQLDVSSDDIRMDGRLYANVTPKSSRVVITFNSKHGPLAYFCDCYADWRENVRAISLCLQYLRKIDEHRVNRSGAQYEGYKRLPAAGETSNGRPKIETPKQAATFMSGHLTPAMPPRVLLTHPFVFEASYRELAKKFHPDNKATGNDELFVDLQDAAVVLRKHHGIA